MAKEEKEMIIRIEKCPHCGGRNIGQGYQDGYAAVTPKGKVFKSAQLFHLICADCGAVLFSCVNKPEIFMPKEK